MRRPLHSAIRSRAIAIGLVLLAHALLFLLALFGIRSPPRTATEQIQLVSLWLELKPPTPEAEPANLPPPEPRSRAEAPPPVPNVTPSEAPRPAEFSTAITQSPLPPIDWQREGVAAARRQVERTPERETLSDSPKTARKPCELPKSSFVWNPETPRAGLTKTPIPLPFVHLGRCVIGLGFFGCDLGEPPEPNSHLFDDVREGKTMTSSVPDPNICD